MYGRSISAGSSNGLRFCCEHPARARVTLYSAGRCRQVFGARRVGTTVGRGVPTFSLAVAVAVGRADGSAEVAVAVADGLDVVDESTVGITVSLRGSGLGAGVQALTSNSQATATQAPATSVAKVAILLGRSDMRAA